MVNISPALFVEAVEKNYIFSHDKSIYSRELSWEHCYSVFYDTISKSVGDNSNYDYLSLHLSNYLASWGMYRGSSFLLQTDYRVHIPAVQMILKHESVYNLLGVGCADICKESTLNALVSLWNQLREYYGYVRKQIKGEILTPISDILISKILLGTLACVPAFDEYFTSAIINFKISTGCYNIYSIKKLSEYYLKYLDIFESSRRGLIIVEGNAMIYPQMRYLDMGFWELGRQLKSK